MADIEVAARTCSAPVSRAPLTFRDNGDGTVDVLQSGTITFTVVNAGVGATAGGGGNYTFEDDQTGNVLVKQGTTTVFTIQNAGAGDLLPSYVDNNDGTVSFKHDGITVFTLQNAGVGDVDTPLAFAPHFDTQNAVTLKYDSAVFEEDGSNALTLIDQTTRLYRGAWPVSGATTPPAFDGSDAPIRSGDAYRAQEYLYVTGTGTINGDSVTEGDHLVWLVSNPPNSSGTYLSVRSNVDPSYTAGAGIDDTLLGAGTLAVKPGDFVLGGSAELDADTLECDYLPVNYTRANATGVTTNEKHLSSQFKGIDDKFAVFDGNITQGTLVAATNARNIPCGNQIVSFANAMAFKVSADSTEVTGDTQITGVLKVAPEPFDEYAQIVVAGKDGSGSVTLQTALDFDTTHYTLRLPPALPPKDLSGVAATHADETDAEWYPVEVNFYGSQRFGTATKGVNRYYLARTSSTSADFPTNPRLDDELIITQAVKVGNWLFCEGQVYKCLSNVSGLSDENDWLLKSDNGNLIWTSVEAGNNPLVDESSTQTPDTPGVGDWALMYVDSWNFEEPIVKYAKATAAKEASYVPCRFRTINSVEVLPCHVEIYHTGRTLGDATLTAMGIGGTAADTFYYLTDTGGLHPTTPGAIDQKVIMITGANCARFKSPER